MKAYYIIGIDPGVKTGLAIWDRDCKQYIHIGTHKILDAIKLLDKFIQILGAENMHMRCENPKTFVPFSGSNGAGARMQGAGSIKRDYTIWSDYAHDRGISFEGVSVHAVMKKMTKAEFEMLTKHKERTSQHARDAAMLVLDY